MVFLFGYWLKHCMVLNVLILFRALNIAWSGQAFQVTKVEFSKIVEAYGLCFAAFVTANKMEGESPAMLQRKAVATIKALSINNTSHPDLSFFMT